MGRVVRGRRVVVLALALVGLAACGGETGGEAAGEMADAEAEKTLAVELWEQGMPAFGVFVPNERSRADTAADGSRLPPLYTAEGAEVLAQNPLLDYLFLNLEGSYDPDAISAMAEGLARHPDARQTLLVRIPPISTDGAEVARARVIEVFERGADGIVMPHVRSAEEAALAVSFFADAGVSIWSPQNPAGDKVALLMIEDAGALAEAEQIADVPGYSLLACGIGSLSRALGDRAAGEAGTQEVLVQSKRAGLPNMLTASAADVEQRLAEGFLGLLMSGPGADEAIRIGRAAAGR